MGAGTAIAVAKSEPRIKCSVALDPWVFTMSKEIEQGKYNEIKKGLPIFLLNTFTNHEDSAINGFDHLKCYESLRQ